MVFVDLVLENKTRYVEIDKVKSSLQNFLCGVTLGPLLFLVYTNDVPNCLEKTSIKILADVQFYFTLVRKTTSSTIKKSLF